MLAIIPVTVSILKASPPSPQGQMELNATTIVPSSEAIPVMPSTPAHHPKETMGSLSTWIAMTYFIGHHSQSHFIYVAINDEGKSDSSLSDCYLVI